MKRRSLIAVGALVAASALALSGCAGTSGSSGDSSSGSKKTTLRVAVCSYAQTPEFKAHFDAFHKANPSITIQPVDILAANYEDKITTMLAGGDTTDIITVKNLTDFGGYAQKKQFYSKPGLFHAIDHVDLEVRRGMRLGIVGESGCGKTTLARSIIRLIEPTSGTIHFDGQDISHLSDAELMPVRRRIQYIFQNPYGALNPRMTIGEILTEPLVIHGLGGTPKERMDAAAKQIESVGLSAALEWISWMFVLPPVEAAYPSLSVDGGTGSWSDDTACWVVPSGNRRVTESLPAGVRESVTWRAFARVAWMPFGTAALARSL